ncbi:MAG: thiamine ABC transporter substrate-binding protein [Candidatus Thermoplasmatota archaeon]|nr:thiamine ABC transporter substrate-binding protein [Candidatus Thermoplasmatota archaeon]
MVPKTIAIVAVFLVLAFAVGGSMYYLWRSKENDNDLVIYCYDSFVTWGLGPEVKGIFEERYDVSVSMVPCGDVGQLLGKLDAEKGSPKADLAIGIDNSMLHIAKRLDLLEPYVPPSIERVNTSLIFDNGHLVTPYDHGYIAIICNRSLMEKRSLPYPGSILELSDPIYKGQIMLIDPATSSTGSSFLIWSAAVAGKDLGGYLKALSSNSGGRVVGTWDAMYAAFLSGEVPISISYGLDTASEILFYGSSGTVTIVPEKEGYRQIEGAGIVKGAKNRELAERFIEFMLEEDFQSRVGYNVMLPVVPGSYVEPEFLEHGRYAIEHVEPGSDVIEENYGTWMGIWEDSF